MAESAFDDLPAVSHDHLADGRELLNKIGTCFHAQATFPAQLLIYVPCPGALVEFHRTERTHGNAGR